MAKIKAKKFRVLKPFLFRGVHRKPGELMIIVEHKVDQIDSANIEEINDKEYATAMAEGKSPSSPIPTPTIEKTDLPKDAKPIDIKKDLDQTPENTITPSNI